MIGEIISEFSVPIRVRRTNVATTYVNGLAQVTTDVDTFGLECGISVQPLTGKQREVVPEGFRDRNLIKLYTQYELLGIDVVGKVRADRITYNDEDYVVHSVENWHADGAYWKVIAIKEND